MLFEKRVIGTIIMIKYNAIELILVSKYPVEIAATIHMLEVVLYLWMPITYIYHIVTLL